MEGTPNYITESQRADFEVITSMVNENAKVLDLGCGDGSLLKMLCEEKNVDGLGVEGCQSMILSAVRNNVNVIHQDLDKGLSEFSDNSFEYVILSRTLQAVNRPNLLLDEMVRVADKCIVSFVNMGYISARMQLMFTGKMPVTKTLPYSWYDTPNIHLGTIHDFIKLCKSKNIKIIESHPIGRINSVLASSFPNLFAQTCVFMITKDGK